jgi:hypothetical protein
MTQDPWDLPIEPKKSIKVVKTEREATETLPSPKQVFVPTQTIKQATEDVWANDDEESTQKKEGKFDILDMPVTDKDFIDEVNFEIFEAILKEKEMLDSKPEPSTDLDPISKQWKDSGDIIVSYSTSDKMYFKGNEIPHCPAKIYGKLIGLEEPATDPIKAGNLFETLLLGGGRDGAQTTELERKQVSQKQKNEAIKKGLPEPEPEMKIDEIRIRHQVERSKIFLFNHKVSIFPNINTQVPIYKIYKGIKIWGHLDLFPTSIIWNGEERIACIDTKLTANLTSSYGKYCWGSPEQMDITQPLMYYFLLEDIDYSINPYLLKILGKERQFENLIFLYYVADYKVAMEKLDCRFFEVLKTPERMQEIRELIRKVHASLEMYKKQGWPASPHYDLCKSCVQNFKAGGRCQFAINSQSI